VPTETAATTIAAKIAPGFGAVIISTMKSPNAAKASSCRPSVKAANARSDCEMRSANWQSVPLMEFLEAVMTA